MAFPASEEPQSEWQIMQERRANYIAPYRAHVDVELTPRDYEQALMSQTATNPSGLTLALGEVLKKLNREPETTGTNWVAAHPIVQLYLVTLCELAGTWSNIDTDRYSDCADLCRERAHKNC